MRPLALGSRYAARVDGGLIADRVARTAMSEPSLIICSKSTWDPAIRREHAIAAQARDDGHPVVFLERPIDVRALRSSAGRERWVRAQLRRVVRPERAQITVVPRSTLVPGHRSAIAQRAECLALARDLRSVDGLDRATVVATVPWQWPAVANCGAARRVFDCADDWSALLPRRGIALGRLYRRIGREADAVIAVAPDLESRFRAAVSIVPNGAAPELLERPPVTREPQARRMVYVGTLSERFDATLTRALMARLPDWTLDLYGPCQYAGRESAPAPELVELLNADAGRVVWHGPASRAELAEHIDRATVTVVPHRPHYSDGQDGMKLYDYAARARPIVTTVAWRRSDDPPCVRVAATASAFAAAVEQAAGESERACATLRDWAQRQTWAERWQHWSRAAIGELSCAS